jgi:uncharacterized protein DUF4876
MTPGFVRRIATRGAFLAALVLIVACRQETILIAPPADTTHSGGGGGGGGGTVQHAVLTVTLTVATPDTSIASALGWTTGRVPGAVVSIAPSNYPPDSSVAISDSVGIVRFPQLLTREYTISVARSITRVEHSRLGSADQDVGALAGALHVTLDTPGVSVSVPMFAGRRGSLVVSEWWYPANASTSPTGFYPYAGYVEVYNNADTTIYLDGKTFGDAVLQMDGTSQHPCSAVEQYTNDSLGVWAYLVYRFPGTGHDHPLAPGAAAVLATDAIDHRTVNPDATDLSHADFEFIGSADVDNPAVPNMINLVAFEKPGGHGYYADPVFSIPFVADPVALDTLPIAYPFNNFPFYRIPRAAVLDVATFWWPFSTYPRCPYLISPVFDREPGGLIPQTDFYLPSIQRKVWSRPQSGTILQRTKTTVVDFVNLYPRTPGSAP